MEISVRTQLDARADLGEGPCWDSESGRLYWVDINAGRIHATDPVTGDDRTIEAGEKIGAVVLASSGALIAAGEHGFVEIAPGGGISRRLADPEENNPDTRFNDGKCDPAGRFWAGTMSLSRATGSAALYRLDPGGALSKLVEGVTVSNGLAWDIRKSSMFYIDSPTKSVVAFDYRGEDGAISNPRIAFATGPEMGSPDGMSIDAEGMLWIAFYRGGCVARWNPETGELLQRVDIPAPHVTSCCFGGPELKTLFITTGPAGDGRRRARELPRGRRTFRLRTRGRGQRPATGTEDSGMEQIKSIADINGRIEAGKAVVMTADEVISYVEHKGLEKAAAEIDVVSTATFGPMCSSGFFFNVGHSKPKIRVTEAWLDDVPAYSGIAAVDFFLGATELSAKDPANTYYPGEFRFGGGHVIEKLVRGEAVSFYGRSYGTDDYPLREIQAEIRLADLNQAIMTNPRNCYQNYNAAVNSSERMIYTYLGALKPGFGSLGYSSAGQLSPLLNDPFYRSIGIGSRVWLAGAPGIVYAPGTQHSPDAPRGRKRRSRRRRGNPGAYGGHEADES